MQVLYIKSNATLTYRCSPQSSPTCTTTLSFSFFPPSQNSLCKVAVRNSPTHLVWPQLLPSLQLPPAERTEPANAVMAISHLYSFAFQEEMKDKGEPQRWAPVFPPKYIYLANSHLCLQSTSNNGSYIIIELWYSFRLLTALR